MKKNYVYTVGRFNVPHNGHIRYFLNLLNIYEKLIIGIGSCYTANHFRHPVLAFLREKMIYKSLLNAGVNMSRVIFVHIPDFDSWEEWWLHVISIPQIDKVITFATGNEEEITNEIKKRNLKLPFEIFNPEKDVPEEKRYPYRATDLRNSILENNYQLFSEIAASGTIELMAHAGGFVGIHESAKNQAINFVPGRQTVDLVITAFNQFMTGKLVLSGIRGSHKKNFPNMLGLPGGPINDYENPMNAAIRNAYEKTGLKIEIVNRHLEPAHVVVAGQKPLIATMRFLGLYSTENVNLAGDQGGSSQVFHINLDCRASELQNVLRSSTDLTEVAFREPNFQKRNFAYQQNDMIWRAYNTI